MSVDTLKHVLLNIMSHEEGNVQKASCRRLLNDINSNPNKWFFLDDFTEITLEFTKRVYRYIATVLDKSLVDSIEMTVDPSTQRWHMGPKDGMSIKDPTTFYLISTIMIDLFGRINLLNLDKAKTVIDSELSDFNNDESNQNALSKLHDLYSTVINDLLHDLVDIKQYKAKIILTPHGASRMKTTSNHISLTHSSHRGYKVDMSTGDINLNISINGQGGWHLLTKDDYVDILVLVQDPDKGHTLGYVSVLEAALRPTDIKKVINHANNVIQFKPR